MTDILIIILMICEFGLGFILGKTKTYNEITNEIMKEWKKHYE